VVGSFSHMRLWILANDASPIKKKRNITPREKILLHVFLAGRKSACAVSKNRTLKWLL